MIFSLFLLSVFLDFVFLLLTDIFSVSYDRWKPSAYIAKCSVVRISWAWGREGCSWEDKDVMGLSSEWVTDIQCGRGTRGSLEGQDVRWLASAGAHGPGHGVMSLMLFGMTQWCVRFGYGRPTKSDISKFLMILLNKVELIQNRHLMEMIMCSSLMKESWLSDNWCQEKLKVWVGQTLRGNFYGKCTLLDHDRGWITQLYKFANIQHIHKTENSFHIKKKYYSLAGMTQWLSIGAFTDDKID